MLGVTNLNVPRFSMKGIPRTEQDKFVKNLSRFTRDWGMEVVQ